MKTLKFIIPLCMLIIGIEACKKDSNVNPYNDWKSNPKETGDSTKFIDPNTIQGIHKNILSPTCANSGCHDGNFEPDFRTIESSYNTLVNQKAVKTDPDNPNFIYRVVPGKAAESMILHRITHNILGNSGTMPLSIDPSSDWPSNKQQYIDNITTWINNGAKDAFGNPPAAIDSKPTAEGVLVFADGSSSPLSRGSKYDPVIIPSGTSQIEIKIAYSDDKTQPKFFTINTINFSKQPNAFVVSNEKNMTVGSAFSGQGITDIVDFYHSITLNVSDIGIPGQIIWFRTKVSDNVNAVTSLPDNTSMFNLKTYFAVKIE
ncbi:MAG: hypothetical protein H7321_03125 [Bacteroidia bacterium]|nr:hypothetical protein [Bacteroidia bacterium]